MRHFTLVCVVLTVYLRQYASQEIENVGMIPLTAETDSSQSKDGYELTSNTIAVILNQGVTAEEFKISLQSYPDFELNGTVEVAGQTVFVVHSNVEINVDKGSTELRRLDAEPQVKSCQLQKIEKTSFSVIENDYLSEGNVWQNTEHVYQPRLPTKWENKQYNPNKLQRQPNKWYNDRNVYKPKKPNQLVNEEYENTGNNWWAEHGNRKKQYYEWQNAEHGYRSNRPYKLKNNVDPKEIDLWYLWSLNGNVKPSQRIPDAWKKGFTGKGVHICFVDLYLDYNHTDFGSQVRTDIDYDFYEGDDDVYPPSSIAAHGTAVAGMVIAQPGNNLCSVGIAYDSVAVGLNISPPNGFFPISDLSVAQWWSHENGVMDIYSNSWGPLSSGFSRANYVLTHQVLENSSITGRRGYGTIYLTSAGNSGPGQSCNGDSIKNSIYMNVITSVSTTKPASYAQTGSSILCAAYGGDFSHRRRDELIFVLTPYSQCTSLAAGTSLSSPTVAGAVALALEANPHLTWRCIQHLLVRTSKKHDLIDPLREYNWQRNGAGFYTHCRMGFGLLDVKDLVEQAVQWKPLPKQEYCSVENWVALSAGHLECNSDTVLIKDYYDEPCRKIQYLEHVLVDITYEYTAFRGSIVLSLYSPSGTKSCIMTPRPLDNDNTAFPGKWTWTYKSLQFWGENPHGIWRLEFSSIDPSVTVTLTHWSLKLYGTTKPPQPIAYYAKPAKSNYYGRPTEYKPEEDY